MPAGQDTEIISDQYPPSSALARERRVWRHCL